MPESTGVKKLTITLPTELAEKLRSRADSSGYASENEFIQDCLAESLKSDPELEHWLSTVATSRYDSFDQNSQTVSSDDVLRTVEARLNLLRKAG